VHTVRADVVVLGWGSAGKELAPLLTGSGLRHVTVIEEALVGGECLYRACMPSKSMIRQAERIDGGFPRPLDRADLIRAHGKIVAPGEVAARGGDDRSGGLGDQQPDRTRRAGAIGPSAPQLPRSLRRLLPRAQRGDRGSARRAFGRARDRLNGTVHSVALTEQEHHAAGERYEPDEQQREPDH